MFVLEFHSQVEAAELRLAGLTILDGSNRHAVVAFSDDPELALFHERLAAYSGAIPNGQKNAPHEAFFDSIVKIRPYGPQDRISDQCRVHVERLTSPEELRLDVMCWYPDNATVAVD